MKQEEEDSTLSLPPLNPLFNSLTYSHPAVKPKLEDLSDDDSLDRGDTDTVSPRAAPPDCDHKEEDVTKYEEFTRSMECALEGWKADLKWSKSRMSNLGRKFHKGLKRMGKTRTAQAEGRLSRVVGRVKMNVLLERNKVHGEKMLEMWILQEELNQKMQLLQSTIDVRNAEPLLPTPATATGPKRYLNPENGRYYTIDPSGTSLVPV